MWYPSVFIFKVFLHHYLIYVSCNKQHLRLTPFWFSFCFLKLKYLFNTLLGLFLPFPHIKNKIYLFYINSVNFMLLFFFIILIFLMKIQVFKIKISQIIFSRFSLVILNLLQKCRSHSYKLFLLDKLFAQLLKIKETPKNVLF